MFNTVLNDVMFLMVFLLLGFAAREVCKPLQRYFIPSGVIAGTLALIMGPQVLGLVTIPKTWASMPTPMIGIVLTCTIWELQLTAKKSRLMQGPLML